MDPKYLYSLLEQIREKSPLIHNITNYVVMNNTANALLCIGASPVMAHAKQEVEQMTAISSALVINIGTLSKQWIKGMIKAGKTANQKNIPLIFDPVGVGATKYRNEATQILLSECKPNIIRGNASEIAAIIENKSKTKGVDSTLNSVDVIEKAKSLAKETKAIVVVSGADDVITDGNKIAFTQNGNPMLTRITGMGCTSTAIVAAFAGINKNYFEASIAGMAIMGITGEIAAKKSQGPGSLQLNFLDTLYNLNENDIIQNLRIKYE